MNVIDLKTAVSASSYPGRGIIIGANEDGRAVVAYFIMGRSENSRNRIFMPHADELRTEAFDPTLMKDPSLIIYNPVRVLGESTIVTNGDQTDTIYDHMVSGGSFETALSTRSFEPDAPNYTPRISGIVTMKGKGFSYKLSILKSMGGSAASCAASSSAASSAVSPVSADASPFASFSFSLRSGSWLRRS